jgi:hypothetical protein
MNSPAKILRFPKTVIRALRILLLETSRFSESREMLSSVRRFTILSEDWSTVCDPRLAPSMWFRAHPELNQPGGAVPAVFWSMRELPEVLLP